MAKRRRQEWASRRTSGFLSSPPCQSRAREGGIVDAVDL
uniref:AGL19 n=1 Tax=Arundo donax TaxID=35708 RepID=A0A0A9GDE8_ARUDO